MRRRVGFGLEAIKRLEAEEPAISAENAIWLGMATLVAMGVVLRARGFVWGTIPFWGDEAAWTAKLIDMPLAAPSIRPLGFLAVCKFFVHLFSASETVLRLLPWSAGIVALLLAPLVAKRLFTSSVARLLFVGVVALHPGAIDLAKEFKPYSVGLALHMAYLLLGLRYIQGQRTRDLAILLGLLLVGVLFAQDTLFAFPGLFSLLLFETFRTRRVRHLIAVALAATLTLGIIAALYFASWRKMTADSDRTTDYWGSKYDVFYVPNAAHTGARAAWTAKHLVELLALPGMRRESWHQSSLSDSTLSRMKRLDLVVWGGLALLGVAALATRRRGREALLLIGPLVVLTCFNAAGDWPLGAFRTNLFALVYGAGLAASALDSRRAQPAHWELVPVGALVLLPYLVLDRSLHARKTSSMVGDSAFTAAMTQLERMQAEAPRPSEQSLVALGSGSCGPWRYYTRYHPDKARAAEYMQRFDAHCEKGLRHMAQLLRKGLDSPDSRAFLLLSSESEMEQVEQHLPKDLLIDAQRYVGKRDQLVVRVRLRPPDAR